MKKNGFTLIELLAVIVILAIIALIVTPIVSGIITSARNSANARSVEGHIRNVELAIITDAFAKASGDLAIYDTTGSKATHAITDEDSIRNTLTMPSNDNIKCDSYVVENGQVISAAKCANKDDSANWHHTYKYTVANGAEVDGDM